MLEVNGLSKQFGGLTALSDVSFSIRKGEIMSLIGPNGAGKTTCLNLVTGFLKPSAGTVRYCDEDITGLPPYAAAQRGLIRTFQKTNVLRGLTVFGNVLTARYRHGERSLWRTFFAGGRQRERGLRDEAAALIETVGLGARMNTDADSLSCGELRLLEVAVALSAGPRVLILDEPAAGLNTHEADRLGDVLKRIVKEHVEAMLLVEHNMALVMAVSDHIVVLDFGRNIAAGTPLEVRTNPDVVTAYLGKPAA
ncbi:branched-chain amino acid transport system ATP-binding protein [Bradyrhizobium sp. LB1.3]